MIPIAESKEGQRLEEEYQEFLHPKEEKANLNFIKEFYNSFINQCHSPEDGRFCEDPSPKFIPLEDPKRGNN